MALFHSLKETLTLLPKSFGKPQSLCISLSSSTSSSSSGYDQTLSNDHKISTAVSLLTHHRAKSRWGHLRVLFPTGFTSNQFSQIVLCLKNNPNLSLRFFLFTRHKSLCFHDLNSYATIIHVMSRARLKGKAQILITEAIRFSPALGVFRVLVKTYRECDSAPFVFDLLIESCLEAKKVDESIEIVRLLISRGISPRLSTCNHLILGVLRKNGPLAGYEIYREVFGFVNREKRITSKILGGNSTNSKTMDETNPNTHNLDGGEKMGEISPNLHSFYNGEKLTKSITLCGGTSPNVDTFDNGRKPMKSKALGSGISPNVHTFNTLMECFYQDGALDRVPEIWDEMVESNCSPSVYTYSLLMAVYCEEGKMVEAERVWDDMRVGGVQADVVAYNTIIGGFCKAGEVEKAEEFVREMEMHGIESSCITYEHLISGYCKVGNVDLAMLLFKDMCRKKFRPEVLTVDMLIGRLSDRGRVIEGLELLNGAIGDLGLLPRGNSYAALIQGLCEVGMMEEALKLQAEMVGKGFEPNSDVYNAFIYGYEKQGNVEMAETLRKEKLEAQIKKA